MNLKDTSTLSLGSKPQTTLTLIEAPLPPLLVSSTKITDNSAYSFVEIDVDWSRNLAYLGSRKTNTCLNVVDFSNHYAPALVKTIGSSSLQTCLGVKLFDNNTKVLLSSDNNNKIAAWNLTANPTDYASWTSMGEHALGTKGRRIAKITPTSANNFEIHVSKRDGVLKANLDTSGGVGVFTTLNAYSNTTNLQSSAIIGGKIVLQSSTGTVEPIHFLSSSLLAESSIATSFLGWTAVGNEAGTKAFLGGGGPPGGSAFLKYDGNTITATKEFVLSSTCNVRNADFAMQDSKEYLYSLCSEGRLDVYDVSDGASPILVKRGQISSFESEVYGVKVKPNSNTAIVISNRGDFIIIDLAGLEKVTSQYPEAP